MCDVKKLSDREWFSKLLHDLARVYVGEINNGNSFSEREIALLRKGVEEGLVSIRGSKFQLKDEEKHIYSFFTLNREYLVQIAAYVELINKYGYPLERCKFEYHLMDVVVFQENGSHYIYVEAKKADNELQKLSESISKYSENVPMDVGDRGNDPLRKCKYIVKDRPKYLWLVGPEARSSFLIEHTETGFHLKNLHDIPKHKVVFCKGLLS